MRLFEPDFVFFEPDALRYPLGAELLNRFKEKGIPIQMTTSHNQVRNIPGASESEKYKNAKRTLVVGVKRTLKFETSKPSADYAIPIATGCMGHCHYCYLQTTMGNRPYIRVYVNLEEICDQARNYIDAASPQVTTFEAACTSDPLGLEHLTGSLAHLIRFFAGEENGRLRFVSKYANVESLLHIPHQRHTRIRFSINAAYVIRHFEPGTHALNERLEAAAKVMQMGYPTGFIVAPLIMFTGWEEEYERLFEKLDQQLPPHLRHDLTFELIQHRYTQNAKNIILNRYPKTKLTMNDEERKKKWGKYGRVKYVYKDESALKLKETVEQLILRYLPEARVDYFT